MTPLNTDTPLRRSEAGTVRDTGLNMTMNDDEAERREARRRTLLQDSVSSVQADSASTIEESENLKRCMEIYNGNKLSRDNAWSVSLIDTLSTLLDRHHKSMNNFKIAGSSLEASSKVYGLRVDSVHTDVLRMTAGLNAQQFKENHMADDDDEDNEGANNVATGGDEAANPSADGEAAVTHKAAKKKKAKRAVATVTKNKETLNGRLDTVPLQDPVFGKLNSTVGSINASDRLMNNILFTSDSELRLSTKFSFWDGAQLPESDNDYTEEVLKAYDGQELSAEEVSEPPESFVACERLMRYAQMDHLQLRPLHSGYVISDTPEVKADETAPQACGHMSDDGGSHDNEDMFANDGGDPPMGPTATQEDNEYMEMSMAFDMNAECEPLPELGVHNPVVGVDMNEFDDLTREERTAIDRCRNLRVKPHIIEDLRPVDSTSKLEYSYRPMDKISQFWAGPSHWKFKRNRPTHASMLANAQGSLNSNADAEARQRRAHQRMQAKNKRFKVLNFCDNHDEKFVRIDGKYKGRKVNLEKRWDRRKLKLPTDLQLDVDMFGKFTLMLGITMDIVSQDANPLLTVDDDATDGAASMPDDHFADNAPLDDGMPPLGHADGDGTMRDMDMEHGPADMMEGGEHGDGTMAGDLMGPDGEANNTVLEIATDFEGAPSQVTKIIVPFAKRAKVIDMKGLKRSCTALITKQLRKTVAPQDLPKHPVEKQEHYISGVATFSHLYNHLPELLTPQMSEALTPSVALYSVLHLANENCLRLIPEPTMRDFQILQVVNASDM